jgi:ABC-type methionine transport system permease subunit
MPQGNFPPQEPQMTGGVKAAWFFIGFLGSVVGILLAFACNWDRPQKIKGDAIKFSAIGFGVSIACGIIFVILYVFLILAIVNGTSGYWY